jgi:hypothetical protein
LSGVAQVTSDTSGSIDAIKAIRSARPGNDAAV